MWRKKSYVMTVECNIINICILVHSVHLLDCFLLSMLLLLLFIFLSSYLLYYFHPSKLIHLDFVLFSIPLSFQLLSWIINWCLKSFLPKLIYSLVHSFRKIPMPISSILLYSNQFCCLPHRSAHLALEFILQNHATYRYLRT